MRFFVASTSETGKARRCLDSVIDDLRPAYEAFGLEPQVLDWTKVPPSAGRAQKVIFDHTDPESWEVFVLILWYRFGTPPGSHKTDGSTYQSGIEEEFEKVYELWKRHRRPRIMVYYWTKKPPVGVDATQRDALSAFLTRIRDPHGNTPSLVIDFDSIERFREVLKENLLDVLNEAKEIYRPVWLRKSLQHYKQNLDNGKLIERIIVQQCESLARHIEELNDEKLTKVGTQVLYETILDSLTKYNYVDILDQDINRWNELIDDAISMFSTFNYSREILLSTVEHARQNPDYRLRRVYVLTESDLRDYGARIEQIIASIHEFIADVQQQIIVRFYLVNANRAKRQPKDHEIEKYIRDARDIVIVRSPDDQAILREDITYLNRKPARATDSEISVLQKEIEEARRRFDRIYQAARPLSDLQRLLARMTVKKKPRKRSP